MKKPELEEISREESLRECVGNGFLELTGHVVLEQAGNEVFEFVERSIKKPELDEISREESSKEEL